MTAPLPRRVCAKCRQPLEERPAEGNGPHDGRTQPSSSCDACLANDIVASQAKFLWIILRPVLSYLLMFALWIAGAYSAIAIGLPKVPVLAVSAIVVTSYLGIARPNWLWGDPRIEMMREVIGDLGVTLIYIGAGLLMAWLMITGRWN